MGALHHTGCIFSYGSGMPLLRAEGVKIFGTADNIIYASLMHTGHMHSANSAIRQAAIPVGVAQLL